MKCQFCGAQLLDNAKFCEECGSAQQNYSDSAPVFTPQPQYQQQGYQQYGGYQNQYQQPQYGQSRAGMGESRRSGEPESPIYTNFGTAIKLFFHNWKNFSGRSTRSEFWYAYLFQMIIGTVIGYVPFLPLLIFGLVISLVVYIPFLAVSIRRLHDIGKSGWWYLIAFTCVGAFVLLYWYSKPGDPCSNQYGPSAEELDAQNPPLDNSFNNYNNYNNYN